MVLPFFCAIFLRFFMKKLFVGNLDANATQDSVKALFSEFGIVRSIALVMDIFSGKCKGSVLLV